MLSNDLWLTPKKKKQEAKEENLIMNPGGFTTRGSSALSVCEKQFSQSKRFQSWKLWLVNMQNFVQEKQSLCKKERSPFLVEYFMIYLTKTNENLTKNRLFFEKSRFSKKSTFRIWRRIFQKIFLLEKRTFSLLPPPPKFAPK